MHRALIRSASMTLVAGVDSSTQATKVLVVDADSGEVVRESSSRHPEGTEVDPQRWLDALHGASRDLLAGVRAISVAGQQHGMVLLDRDGEPVRPALLWNDTRSAGSAADLVEEFGGPLAWAREVGTVPVASLTVTKLRWTARAEPEAAAAASSVLLPHDWLTWHLLGRPAEAVTDRGDASGTGYFSTPQDRWRPDLLELGFGRSLEVPRVCAAGERVGVTTSGMVVAAGTGDNMAAALGAGAGEGDVLVSIGTSGTVFASAQRPSCDPTGAVAGFADAAGAYLPLVATLNAARVLVAGAAMLGVDLHTLDELALQAEPGAGGWCSCPTLRGNARPTVPTPPAGSPGSPGAMPLPPTLRGRWSRACCAAWRMVWTRWQRKGSRCAGCCCLVAVLAPPLCGRSLPPCSKCPSSCWHRGSTSRSAPRRRQHGRWRVPHRAGRVRRSRRRR